MGANASIPGPPERGPAAYIAELIGTFALVFFICMAVTIYVGSGEFLTIGIVHIFVLFMLIQTLAVVCGAHFNPAVTIALTMLRQLRPSDAVIYVVVQLIGGILGALLTKAILSDEGAAVNYGAPAVNAAIGGNLQGMLVEAIGTFFLVWAIVGVAVNPRGSAEWAALVIGGTLGLVVIVGAPLTGAGFNPARSFGPALVSGEFGGAGTFLLVYVLGPVVGAVLAAGAYVRLAMAPGKKGLGGAEPVG